MTRLAPIGPEGLDEDQQALWDAVTRGRRASAAAANRLEDGGGGLAGPFNAMLAAGNVGRAASDLGEAIRFGTELPDELLEVAILVTGRSWRAEFEWWAHARLAAAAGVPDEVIEAIRVGRRPDADDRTLLVHDAAVELLETRSLSDETYAALVSEIGERQTAEFAMTMGYYGLVSMLLNVFDVAPPDPVSFD